jgi:hypothetical protein
MNDWLKGDHKMNFSWIEPLNEKEEEVFIEFIQYTWEGFYKWGGDPKNYSNDDRCFDHILHFMVRDITRIIGEYKNLKMSYKAKEIIGECNCLKDIENAKKLHPGKIVLDHNPPAKTFYDEFKTKKIKNEPFSKINAIRWINEASIVAITEEENRLLTSRGYMENRPPDAYDRLGIKTIEVRKNK